MSSPKSFLQEATEITEKAFTRGRRRLTTEITETAYNCRVSVCWRASALCPLPFALMTRLRGRIPVKWDTSEWSERGDATLTVKPAMAAGELSGSETIKCVPTC